MPADVDRVAAAVDLGVQMGNYPVLTGVTMELLAGTWQGLVGPNGSGKTTLMRAILGLVRPTRGHLELFGSQPPAPAGSVGISFGARLSHPSRRVGTELLVRVAATGGTKDDVARAWRETGLTDPRVRCGALSLGQAQRLSVVAALATRPRLLVLDEPTVGMDADAVHWLRARLRRYTEAGGCAWVSSHDLVEVERSADAVQVMTGGRLTFTGTVRAFTGDSRLVRLRSSEPLLLSAALDSAGLAHRTGADDAVYVETSSVADLGRLLAREGVPLVEMTQPDGSLESSLKALSAAGFAASGALP